MSIFRDEMLDSGCEILDLGGEKNFLLKALCKEARLQFPTALIHTDLK
jgi:hypothetical protein